MSPYQKMNGMSPFGINAIITVFLLAVVMSAGASEQTNRASWFTNFAQSIPGQSVYIDFVAIPGGQVEIGSPPSEPGREMHEPTPKRTQVKPFWLGKCEITWR
jgi:formylglycine-generating enzyme required for sulfatase activity